MSILLVEDLDSFTLVMQSVDNYGSNSLVTSLNVGDVVIPGKEFCLLPPVGDGCIGEG